MKAPLMFAIVFSAYSISVAAEYVPQSDEEKVALAEMKAQLGATLSQPEPKSGVGEMPEQVNHARSLRNAKAYKMALEEYCAVYDSPARKLGWVEVSVPREIAALGKDYPPALAELKRRRDVAKAKALESPANVEEAQEYGWICRALGDSDAALKLWDQFPAGDPRRRAIGGQVYVMLVEKKRYAEALEAHPLELMIRFLEQDQRTFASAENAGSRYFGIVLNSRGRDVEALAGAGRISDALELRDRLLSIDSSEATKEMIQSHLKRAGYVAPAADRN